MTTLRDRKSTYRQVCEMFSSANGSSKDTLTFPCVLLITDPALYTSALLAVLLCCFFNGLTVPPAGEMMTAVPGLWKMCDVSRVNSDWDLILHT